MYVRIFAAFLLAIGLWCAAHAQVPTTGAGKGAPGGGGSFSLTYESSATSSVNASTYNFGTLTYGSGCTRVVAALTAPFSGTPLP